MGRRGRGRRFLFGGGFRRRLAGRAGVGGSRRPARHGGRRTAPLARYRRDGLRRRRRAVVRRRFAGPAGRREVPRGGGGRVRRARTPGGRRVPCRRRSLEVSRGRAVRSRFPRRRGLPAGGARVGIGVRLGAGIFQQARLVVADSHQLHRVADFGAPDHRAVRPGRRRHQRGAAGLGAPPAVHLEEGAREGRRGGSGRPQVLPPERDLPVADLGFEGGHRRQRRGDIEFPEVAVFAGLAAGFVAHRHQEAPAYPLRLHREPQGLLLAQDLRFDLGEHFQFPFPEVDRDALGRFRRPFVRGLPVRSPLFGNLRARHLLGGILVRDLPAQDGFLGSRFGRGRFGGGLFARGLFLGLSFGNLFVGELFVGDLFVGSRFVRRRRVGGRRLSRSGRGIRRRHGRELAFRVGLRRTRLHRFSLPRRLRGRRPFVRRRRSLGGRGRQQSLRLRRRKRPGRLRFRRRLGGLRNLRGRSHRGPGRTFGWRRRGLAAGFRLGRQRGLHPRHGRRPDPLRFRRGPGGLRHLGSSLHRRPGRSFGWRRRGLAAGFPLGRRRGLHPRHGPGRLRFQRGPGGLRHLGSGLHRRPGRSFGWRRRGLAAARRFGLRRGLRLRHRRRRLRPGRGGLGGLRGLRGGLDRPARSRSAEGGLRGLRGGLRRGSGHSSGWRCGFVGGGRRVFRRLRVDRSHPSDRFDLFDRRRAVRKLLRRRRSRPNLGHRWIFGSRLRSRRRAGGRLLGRLPLDLDSGGAGVRGTRLRSDGRSRGDGRGFRRVGWRRFGARDPRFGCFRRYRAFPSGSGRGLRGRLVVRPLVARFGRGLGGFVRGRRRRGPVRGAGVPDPLLQVHHPMQHHRPAQPHFLAAPPGSAAGRHPADHDLAVLLPQGPQFRRLRRDPQRRPGRSPPAAGDAGAERRQQQEQAPRAGNEPPPADAGRAAPTRAPRRSGLPRPRSETAAHSPSLLRG